MSAIPDRGFRNCNPCNIRKGTTQWQGMAAEQSDPTFVIFSGVQWGIRAACRILMNYQNDGFTTVRQIINRWAPPSDNNPDDYVPNVANACGIGPDDHIDVVAFLPKLIPAIITQENGSQPYSTATIDIGIGLASNGI